MKSFVVLCLFVFVAVANSKPFGFKPNDMRLLKSNFSASVGNKQIRGNIDWDTCGGDNSIQIHKLNIPDTIEIPGSVPFDIDVELMQDFDNFAVDLKLEKKMGLWIDIPCVNNVGSCFYDDICALVSEVDSGILDALEQAGLTICPFKQGRYTAANTIEIPDIPGGGGIDALISGRYRLKMKMYRFPATGAKHLHLCVDVELKIDA